jgi:hypothetical protein
LNVGAWIKRQLPSLRNLRSQPTSENLGRPIAGFTWQGLFAILLSLGGSAVAFLVSELFFGLILLFVPTRPDGTQPFVGVFYNIIVTVTALPVLAGFGSAVAASREFNLERGRGRGRPVFGWRILLSPRGLARYLFTPSGVYDQATPADARLGRLALARSIVGVVVVAIVVVYYRGTTFNEYVDSQLGQSQNVMLFAAVAALLCCLISVVVVSGANRVRATRAVLRPLRVIVTVIIVAAAILYYSARVRQQYGTGQEQDYREAILFIVINPIAIWLLVFIVSGLYYINKSTFSVGDAHPLLPSVATVAVVWTVILVDVASIHTPWSTVAVGPSLPARVAQFLSVFGALTATVLAVAEFVGLRRAGVRFRTGTWL